MKEKGAVAVSKENKINYYTPVLDRETYKKTQTKTLVQKLYKQGMNDREIGEEAVCSGCVVWKWRKKNKLPPNKRKKPY